MEKGECLLTELQFCFLIYILYKPLISLTTLFSSSHPGCWNPMESYRLKFQIVSGWLVEGDTLQEVWSDLHRDSRKLTLHGLRGRLPPPCLLCFCLAAAALEEVWMGEKGWPTVICQDTWFTWYGETAMPQLPRTTRKKSVPANWLQLLLDSSGNQLSLHIHSGLSFPELFYMPAKKLF